LLFSIACPTSSCCSESLSSRDDDTDRRRETQE